MRKTLAVRFLKQNAFVLALLGGVLLAVLFPQLGAKNGPLKAELLSKAGVMVIFLLQGLTLKTRELTGGLRHLRLHAFIQGWIFLGSAVVLIGMALILKVLGLGELAHGFVFIALIPTTISSAVAFTSAAGGNVPAAIFNATFSNVWGVFWVPTLSVLFFAGGREMQGDLVGPLLLKVAWLILVPLIAGQILRPFLHRQLWFHVLAPRFKVVNHSIILFIVFAAFSQSILSHAWRDVGPGALALLLGLVVLAILLIHAGTWFSGKWMALPQPDRITALLCGSQKTLAAGAPMAVAIFANGEQLAHVNLGLLLLPLLCYHPLQLFLAALILPRLIP